VVFFKRRFVREISEKKKSGDGVYLKIILGYSWRFYPDFYTLDI
jgi:hypothetical protein